MNNNPKFFPSTGTFDPNFFPSMGIFVPSLGILLPRIYSLQGKNAPSEGIKFPLRGIKNRECFFPAVGTNYGIKRGKKGLLVLRMAYVLCAA